mgnify:CR=1 FL=1
MNALRFLAGGAQDNLERLREGDVTNAFASVAVGLALLSACAAPEARPIAASTFVF